MEKNMKKNICICVTWSLCCTPETHTPQINYTLTFFDFFKIKKNLKNKTVPRGRHALTNSFNYLLGRCALQCSFILSVSSTYCNTLSNTVQPGACCRSLSRVQHSSTPWTAARQASLSFNISWSCSNSCALSQWCHPTISSSVAPFSSCLQSFPASGSFLMSQLFASSGQSIGASESVLPMNIQGWFPLGMTGLISLQSKGLSRVFSNITKSSNSSMLSLLYGPTLKSIRLLEKP